MPYTFGEKDPDEGYGPAGTGVINGTDSEDYFFGEKGRDDPYGEADTNALYDSNGTDGDDVIYGNNWKNTINGGEGIDVLHGGDGEDHLFGGLGVDFLFGEGHSDFLYGNEDDDWLDGGDGDDQLMGGEGADYLTGGSGADSFLYLGDDSDGDFSMLGPDHIMDFSTADDQIDLEVPDANPLPALYEEDMIGYDKGYDEAKLHAESLLNGENYGKKYAFVTDQVDGYLFVDFGGNGEIDFGVILVGLTALSDFDVWDIL